MKRKRCESIPFEHIDIWLWSYECLKNIAEPLCKNCLAMLKKHMKQTSNALKLKEKLWQYTQSFLLQNDYSNKKLTMICLSKD